MSAYVVNDAHIDAILATYRAVNLAQRTDEPVDLATLSHAGAVLLLENCQSVACHYKEDVSSAWEKYKFPDIYNAHTPSPLASLSLCDCLEYQSCEHEGWQFSEAYRLLNKIRGTFIRALPGHSEAHWSVD